MNDPKSMRQGWVDCHKFSVFSLRHKTGRASDQTVWKNSRRPVYYLLMREYISSYFSRIAAYHWWIVLLELLLIGVAVHSVIEFLRGTRGARLIKGTALFLVVAYIIIQLG